LRNPFHAAFADPVSLGKLKEFRAGSPLLDQLLHDVFAQPINHSPRLVSLRGRPDAG
jgi:hypothetical protein